MEVVSGINGCRDEVLAFDIRIVVGGEHMVAMLLCEREAGCRPSLTLRSSADPVIAYRGVLSEPICCHSTTVEARFLVL